MRIPLRPRFWAVALGHTVNDIFMSMGPVVLAFLRSTTVSISNSQIGLATGLIQLTGAVSQPFFGLAADRNGGRWLGAFGVLWTITMMSISLITVAVTGSFWLMLFPFVIAALGSGAFHPVGAMNAAETDHSHIATHVSWFFLMGQLGLALGPLLAGLLLQTAEAATLHLPGESIDTLSPVGGHAADVLRILVIAPLVVFPVFMMARFVPDALSHRTANESVVRNLKLPPLRAGLTLLALVVLRSLGQPGSVSFIPVLFENKGWSPSEYGLITSSFWVMSGISGIWLGNLADRYDHRAIMAVSMFACAPAFFLLPLVDGPLAFLMAMLAGGFSGGSHSLLVVSAQELIPGGKGFASGAILGTIFGVGAVGSVLIGVLSDSIGLDSAFQLVAVGMILAGMVALLLPRRTPVPALAAAD